MMRMHGRALWLSGLLLLATGDRVLAEAAAAPPLSEAAYAALAGFYQYDPQIRLESRVVRKDDAPTYTREKVVFTGGRGDRVPAYVMVPKSGKVPRPLVLVIDGWTGGKERWWEDDTWPRGGLLMKALAEAGFGALVMDSQFHGERDAKLGYVPVEEFVCSDCANLRREMVVESVVDHRRALDYLGSRGDIDMARIGALGHSMGGIMTFALAALEPRLKAGVACVTPARRAETWTQEPAVSPYTFAPRIKVPLLMLMGRTDSFYGAKEAGDLFDALATSHKALEWYETGHRLPAEYVPRAVGWLKERLK